MLNFQLSASLLKSELSSIVYVLRAKALITDAVLLLGHSVIICLMKAVALWLMCLQWVQ